MKILILTAPFGAGHITAAHILQADLGTSHSVIVWNSSDYQPTWKGRTFREWLYFIATVKLPWLWSIMLWIFETIPKWFFLWFNRRVFLPSMKTVIEKEKPDLILSTYGFFGALLEHQECTANIPIASVVTDAFSHSFYWFYGQYEHLFVMSDIVFEYAKKKGVNPERLTIIPPLVRQEFYRKASKNQIFEWQKDYSLAPSLPVVLVLGGGEGLAEAKNIVQALEPQLNSLSLIVVCGKDVRTKKSLDTLKKQKGYANLHPLGYTKEIYQLMSVSDIVISKAGPGTIIEAITLNKPLILTSYLRHEKGNVDYVVHNKYGLFEPDPQKHPNLIDDILAQNIVFDVYSHKPFDMNHVITQKHTIED